MKEIFTKQIPNMLTILRIILVIIAFFLIIDKMMFIGVIIIIIAAITDFLDGFLARALDAQSILGAKMDQIADKLFEILISIAIIICGNYFLISTMVLELIFAGLIVYKMFKLKHWAVSTKAGKVKTTLLFLTIIFGLLKLIDPNSTIMETSFLIIWGIATIFQLFANLKIVLEYSKEKKSIELSASK